MKAEHSTRVATLIERAFQPSSSYRAAARLLPFGLLIVDERRSRRVGADRVDDCRVLCLLAIHYLVSANSRPPMPPFVSANRLNFEHRNERRS